MVWFGLVLWDINHCRLFNTKSPLYIYIKYIWFGWVGFCSISTIVGYLMANPLYTYIINIDIIFGTFFDNILKRVRPLFALNSFIIAMYYKHNLTSAFCLHTMFVLFGPSIWPYQVLPLRVRVDQGAISMKEYSTLPKSPKLKPHHLIV